jgi:3-hydroxyisobutyrate dehydrogenase
MTARVAMVGLGRMGGPMTDHVLAAGFEVSVFDVAEAAMAPRVAKGAVGAASPAEAAVGATVVGVVVLDGAQAITVVDGPDGVLRTLEPGAVVCLHTTVTLDTVHALAAAGERVGVTVLDSGISGGEAGAQAGTLLSLVGGPADAIEQARPVLMAFSKEVVHAGPLGAGMALKLARNAVGYAWMHAVYEAAELAHRSGVDVAVLEQAIRETGTFEQAFTPILLGGPEPFPPDTPEAMLEGAAHVGRLADKDLDHTLALADRLGVDLPGVRAVRQGFHRSMRI